MIKTVQEVLAQQRNGGGSSSSNVAGVGGAQTTPTGAQNASATLHSSLSKAKILVLGNVDVGKTGIKNIIWSSYYVTHR